MKIDIPSSTTNVGLSKTDLAQVSKQMADILIDLKVSTAKPIFVTVSRTIEISEGERQTLLSELESKPGESSKDLVDLLKKRDTQLIELKFRGKIIYVISQLKVTPGQTLPIKAADQHFTTTTNPQPGKDPVKQSPGVAISPLIDRKVGIAEEHTNHKGATQSTIYNKDAPSKNRIPHTPALDFASSTKQSPTPSVGSVIPTAAGTKTPHDLNPPVLGQRQSLASAETPATKNLGLPTDGERLPRAPAESVVPQGKSPSLAQAVSAPQQKYNSIASIEPPKTPKQELVQREFSRHLPSYNPKIYSTPQSGKTIFLSPLKNPGHTSVSMPLLLNKVANTLQHIAKMPLIISPSKPLSTDQIRQAILNSGVFFENKIRHVQSEINAETTIQAVKEQDARALFTQLQTSLNQFPITTNLNPKDDLLFDGLGKILQQLFRGSGNAEQSHRPTPQHANRTELQALVSKAVTQIQFRQLQSLVSQFDPTPGQTPQLHVDIPLRLPDGVFNLALILFEPEKPQDKKNKRQKSHSRKARWKLQMTLDLGDCGEMSSELLVSEKELDLTLWATNDQLRANIKNKLLKFKQNLQMQGVEVRHMRCADEPPPSIPVNTSRPMVDLET